MGVSEGSEGGIAGGGCSPGTIVWVRRRNGSWWPGKILGPDEVDFSSLMSTRSGTPVKLLGRDDASVDWYNLEKSKRVKAFRCGEFDACIEKVETSHGFPIRKREKYARREDAILHALELEKMNLEMKNQKRALSTNYASNRASGREFSNFSSESYTRNADIGNHSKFTNNKSKKLSRKVPLLHVDYKDDHSSIHKTRDGKQNNLEAAPRTRGLQDLGIHVPSQRKHSQLVAWEGSQKLAHNHVDVLSSIGHSVEGSGRSVISKSVLAVKRKSSHGGNSDDSPVKKRDKRRTLVQVLQSTAKVPSAHYFQPDCGVSIMPVQGEKEHVGVGYHAQGSKSISVLADPNVSMDSLAYSSKQITAVEMQCGTDKLHQHLGSSTEEFTSTESIETTESDSYEKEYTEPDMEDEEHRPTDVTQQVGPGPKLSGRLIKRDPAAFHGPVRFGKINSEEMPPSCITEMHAYEQTADTSSEMGMSRWHMKGRRNIRNLPKRTTDLTDWKISKMAYKQDQRALGQTVNHIKEEIKYACDEGDYSDKDMGCSQLVVFGNRIYPKTGKVAKDQGRSHDSFISAADNHYDISPSDSEEQEQCFSSVCAPDVSSHAMVPMLVDVELKVRASYPGGERVPLVSLMSKLNGKAIIGHPVQVEILEDGSSVAVVSRHVASPDRSSPSLQIWRTARRTAVQRMPHPNNDVKLYSGSLDHEARLAKKSPRKFKRKLLKNISLSSQKTRTLSSLASDQKQRCLGAFIKPDGGLPRITCVPVKVVFSRILEAVGRP